VEVKPSKAFARLTFLVPSFHQGSVKEEHEAGKEQSVMASTTFVPESPDVVSPTRHDAMPLCLSRLHGEENLTGEYLFRYR